MKTNKILSLALLLTIAIAPVSAQFKNAEDSICKTNRFLYGEAYKSKQYQDAYEPWKIALQTCPSSSKNLYIQGAVILKQLFSSSKDAEKRVEIVNELMNLYDLRIQYFGEAPEVTARKAYDLQQLRGDAALKEYYELYAKAMSLDASKLDVAFIERYFEATVRYVTKGGADTTLIIDNYDIASDALDAILAATTDSTKKAEIYNVVANIENRFSPFASCDQLVNIYTKKFNANPEDLTLLKKITTILRKKKCMNTDLFFAATENLNKIEPSPSTAYLMAQMNYQRKRYTEAANYVNEALKGADEKDKYNMYILQGLCYTEANSYSAARAAYNKAADLEPTKGEPYRLIAQLYAAGHRSIDDGMNGASAYWAAVDVARKAISVDSSPENVEAAQRLISSYSAGFPKQDKAFDLDLVDGNSFTVPGWIGVTTVVRTKK